MAREVTEAMLRAGEGAHKELLAKRLTAPSMHEELRAVFTAMDDAAPKPTVSPLCADVHKPTYAMMGAGEKFVEDKRYNARSTASLEQAGLVYMAMERVRVEALRPKPLYKIDVRLPNGKIVTLGLDESGSVATVFPNAP